MPEWLDFTSKVVLITGGSRGIGAGMVRAFAEMKARCILNYVADPDGRNLADARQAAQSFPDLRLIECDVSNYEQVGRMMGEIEQAFGGLDVLMNNAGIMRDRSLKKMTPQEWQSVLSVNLTGTWNCLQQATRLLRPGGRIVNISSLSGSMGFFGQANYSASKAGIMALTKVAARELARQQITVNAIAPGFIDTEMGRMMPDDVARKFIEQVPLGRMGQVEDVVNAAVFLCSSRASFITGQVIHVNGGFFMG